MLFKSIAIFWYLYSERFTTNARHRCLSGLDHVYREDLSLGRLFTIYSGARALAQAPVGQNETGSDLRPRSMKELCHSCWVAFRCMPGSRRNKVSMPILPSSLDKAAPEQKCRPKPNAKCGFGSRSKLTTLGWANISGSRLAAPRMMKIRSPLGIQMLSM